MPATKTTTSLKLTCPFCGVHGSTITLDLNEPTKIECGDCSETFTAAEAVEKAQALVAMWEKVVRLVEFAGELASE